LLVHVLCEEPLTKVCARLKRHFPIICVSSHGYWVYMFITEAKKIMANKNKT